MNVEKESMDMPVLAASILIFAKILAAPLGIPGAPLTLISGSLFGYFWGTCIALVGNTIGATLAFLLSRYVFRDYIQNNILPHHHTLQKYNDRLQKRGLSTVIVLRLIPLFPFNVLNFLLGVTTISLRNYFWGSLLGMIPGTYVFVYFGNSLRMPTITNISAAIVMIAALIFFGRLYEKRL
jgi:uncharacterized membrane protein YdjX (TVP38/TMEM64 family)